MWNRRKDTTEEETHRPSVVPSAAEASREGIPLSTVPHRVSEPETPRMAAVGKAVVVKGQIFAREDLYLGGEIEGTVELPEHKLTVGPNARVNASLKARELVIMGTVHGNLEVTEKLDIRKSAKVVGDIKAGRINVEDGAFIKGSIDIIKTETGATAPKPTVTAAPGLAAQPSGRPAALAASASNDQG